MIGCATWCCYSTTWCIMFNCTITQHGAAILPRGALCSISSCTTWCGYSATWCIVFNFTLHNMVLLFCHVVHCVQFHHAQHGAAILPRGALCSISPCTTWCGYSATWCIVFNFIMHNMVQLLYHVVHSAPFHHASCLPNISFDASGN